MKMGKIFHSVKRVLAHVSENSIWHITGYLTGTMTGKIVGKEDVGFPDSSISGFLFIGLLYKIHKSQTDVLLLSVSTNCHSVLAVCQLSSYEIIQKRLISILYTFSRPEFQFHYIYLNFFSEFHSILKVCIFYN